MGFIIWTQAGVESGFETGLIGDQLYSNILQNIRIKHVKRGL